MIIVEAWRAVVRRGNRNLLMTLAVLISAAAAVGLIGFVHATAYRTATTLTDLSAGSMTARLPESSWRTSEDTLLRALQRYPQVSSAGTVTLPGDGGGAAVQIRSSISDVTAEAGVAVVTADGLRARGATVISGGYPSAVEETPGSALLGQRLARELGVGDPSGAVILVNDVRVGVAGIVDDGGEGSILATSLLVSPELATRLGVLPPLRIILMNVEQGTAEDLAPSMPVALLARDPDSVIMTVAASPRELQDKLTRESQTWVTVITSVLGAVSAFTIVTTMQVAVQERRREIGIRRALGMRATRIAAQFCCEAMLTGGAASLLGGALGALGLTAWGRAVGWTILFPPEILFLPVAGLILGGLAGLLPALAATKVDPAELLRST